MLMQKLLRTIQQSHTNQIRCNLFVFEYKRYLIFSRPFDWSKDPMYKICQFVQISDLVYSTSKTKRNKFQQVYIILHNTISNKLVANKSNCKYYQNLSKNGQRNINLNTKITNEQVAHVAQRNCSKDKNLSSKNSVPQVVALELYSNEIGQNNGFGLLWRCTIHSSTDTFTPGVYPRFQTTPPKKKQPQITELKDENSSNDGIVYLVSTEYKSKTEISQCTIMLEDYSTMPAWLFIYFFFYSLIIFRFICEK